MAINSTIITNTILGTSSLEIFVDTVPIEKIVYDNSDNNILFEARDATSISSSDFTKKLQIYSAFNGAIIKTFFEVNQFEYKPFTPSIAVVLKDNGTDELYFSFNLMQSAPKLIDFTCTYPSGNVELGKRNQNMIISYAQWLYFLRILDIYKLFVANIYRGE